MATVIRKEKYQRGALGKLIKWAFIAFNVFMLFWLVSGLIAITGMEAHSDAERIGKAIGGTFGASMILSAWTMGFIVLGIAVLLTRGNKVIVEETATEGPTGPSSRSTLDRDDNWALKADQTIARYVQQAAEQSASAAPASRSLPARFGKRAS
jgi:hypothetical protein